MSDIPPLVTVIVATYNRSATLRWTIESVLRQSFTDFELLVIGDACTDDTEAVVAAFADPRIQWINLPVNSGSQSGPNNEGLRRARGKYIAYLGHDDLWFPWRLSGMVEALEVSGDDFVHGLVALLAPEGVRGVAGKPAIGQDYGTCNMPPSGWLHRRDVVNVVGEWADPETIARIIDVEYVARMRAAGLRMRHLPELSVLKWPSQWWRIYSLKSEYPQEHFADLMRADPKAAYEEVTREIVVRFSEGWDIRLSIGEAVRRLAISVRQAIGAAPFWNYWPFRAFASDRTRRYRRRMRRNRGLDALGR